MMRLPRASLCVLLFVGFRTLGSDGAGVNHLVSDCVEPQGIEPGGGDGVLDLNHLLSPETGLGKPLGPLDFTVPIIPTVAGCSNGLESPIALRLLTGIDSAAFSLASVFHPNGVALDVFGDKATSDSRRRCQPAEGDEDGRALLDMHLNVAITYLLGYTGWKHMPWCSEQIEPLMEAVGCPMSLVIVAPGDPEPSTDTPWGLAKAYIDETLAFLMEHDGWNADGSMGDKEFNRIPFTGDFSFVGIGGNTWNGYSPVNTPYEFTDTTSWQPLLESNGLGYITTQEHVTPHIGVTGRFFGLRTPEDEEALEARFVDPPEYMGRYHEAAREVLQDSALAANNATRQFAISFFDNKFTSLVPLKIAYFLENEFGEAIVEAYAGPEHGVQFIKASEWEPYIRTMPHSEFPSGSSCLCEVYANTIKFWAGTDTIDPPLQFPPPALGGPIVEFSAWSEISEMCGDSRVWAGLHFEGAVGAGKELCGGDDMVRSIAASIDALIDGDESAAVFDRDIGPLKLRVL